MIILLGLPIFPQRITLRLPGYTTWKLLTRAPQDGCTSIRLCAQYKFLLSFVRYIFFAFWCKKFHRLSCSYGALQYAF